MALILARRYGVAVLAVVTLALVSVLAFTSDTRTPDAELSDEELAILRAAESSFGPPAGLGVAAGSAVTEGSAVTTGLSVVTYPTGADVFVEFEPVGVSPVDAHPVDAGAYFLTVTLPGFAPLDTLVFVDRDRISTVYVVLQEEGAFRGGAAGGIEREAAPDVVESAPARTERARPQPVRSEPQPAEARREATARSVPPPPARESAPAQEPTPIREAAPAPAEASPATGTLRITSEPSGATVRLSGRAVGQTPLALQDVEPDQYAVVLEKAGYAPRQERITVGAGQDATLQASLEALTGEVVVLVRPWGSIYVNGELRRSDTDVQYSTQLPEGTHTIRVTHPGLGSQERTVEVQAGGSQRVVVDLK